MDSLILDASLVTFIVMVVGMLAIPQRRAAATTETKVAAAA